MQRIKRTLLLTKATKPVVFQVTITVHECTNIPQSRGKVYCKWKTQPKTKLEGYSSLTAITDDCRAKWDYQLVIAECDMEVNPETNIVKNYYIRLSIRQESLTDPKGFARIGIVKINLAEYVGQQPLTRRYLLEDSSFNSTVQVTVKTLQLGGDPMFKRIQVPEKARQVRRPSQSELLTASSEQESIFAVVHDVLRESEENRAKQLPSK